MAHRYGRKARKQVKAISSCYRTYTTLGPISIKGSNCSFAPAFDMELKGGFTLAIECYDGMVFIEKPDSRDHVRCSEKWIRWDLGVMNGRFYSKHIRHEDDNTRLAPLGVPSRKRHT